MSMSIFNVLVQVSQYDKILKEMYYRRLHQFNPAVVAAVHAISMI